MASSPLGPPSSVGSRAGASCLPGFASYLGVQPVAGAIDAEARLNNQYVLVHMYLLPGKSDRRNVLRNKIATTLGQMKAVQLHDLAYAVPANGDGRGTADEAWRRLQIAGAPPEKKGQDAWDKGDVVYIHYVGDDGMCVLAGAPVASGQPLPDLPP